MKPITITLTTTIDEEIDQAIYGNFYAFSRINPEHPWENRPFVQLKKGGEWIPIKDWKSGRYIITDGQLRAIARHFLEVGKRISGLIDLDEICRAAGISEPFMDGNQWSILKGANIQEGVVGFGDTKEEALVNFIKDIPIQKEQPKSTCKTCGFYENNCPFIRGKLIPYPNKVCKDYTHSAMKEQEQK